MTPAGLPESKSLFEFYLVSATPLARSKLVVIIICRHIRRAHLWARFRGNDRSRGQRDMQRRRACQIGEPHTGAERWALAARLRSATDPLSLPSLNALCSPASQCHSCHVALGCTRGQGLQWADARHLPGEGMMGRIRPDVRHAQGPGKTSCDMRIASSLFSFTFFLFFPLYLFTNKYSGSGDRLPVDLAAAPWRNFRLETNE